MRIANVRGRLTLLETGSEIDVEQASNGRFSSDPHAVFGEWAAFCGLGADRHRRSGGADRRR